MKDDIKGLTLRKGIITEIISKSEYIVEDVLSKERLTMTVPWLFRMLDSKVELGDEIYMTSSSSEKKIGKIVRASSLKNGGEFYREKIDLDKKHEFVKCKAIVTIAKVKEQISLSEYIVEDVFDNERIHMVLRGKLVMNYVKLKIDEEVYVQRSPDDSTRGGLLIETDFKMDRNGKLSRARFEIEQWLR